MREKIRQPRQEQEEQKGNTVRKIGETAVTDKKPTDGIDDLLDEIDSVLEKNAEAFVRDYVQKGGE